jgi:hypothetical protein
MAQLETSAEKTELRRGSKVRKMCNARKKAGRSVCLKTKEQGRGHGDMGNVESVCSQVHSFLSVPSTGGPSRRT